MLRLAVAVLLGAALACARGPDHSQAASLPGHLDPSHHVRFQNGYVRVLETALAPGEVTGAHSHPHEGVIVFLTEGAFEITRDDGSVERGTVDRHQVAFGDSSIVHRTRNTSDGPVRTLAVEIFSQPPPRDGLDGALPPGEVLIDNAKVRTTRLRLEHGRALDLAGPSPAVLIALAAGTVQLPGAGSAEVLAPGDVRWLAPGRGTITALGEAPLDAVVVLLKPRG